MQTETEVKELVEKKNDEDGSDLNALLDEIGNHYQRDVSSIKKIFKDNWISTVNAICDASAEDWEKWKLPTQLASDIKKRLNIPSQKTQGTHVMKLKEKKELKRHRTEEEENQLKNKKKRKIKDSFKFNFDVGVIHPMLFAYGCQDFARVSKKFYLDRTKYIPLIENVTELAIIFLRPRRFGKSLFLSTLAYYYDIRYKNNFDALFGHLDVASHKPSPSLQPNSWLVLHWNFSGIGGNTVKDFEESFHNYLNINMTDFKVTYQNLLDREIKIYGDAIDSFNSLAYAVAGSSKFRSKLYVLIDEYDTSVNEFVKSGNQEMINHLKKEEGILPTFRRLFTNLKNASIGRIFITGVTPLALNDFTSGFNIAVNITFNLNFATMCGFTEEEVTNAFNLVVKNQSDRKKQLALMRLNFNGYKFHSQQEQKLYNPTIAIYYLTNLMNKSMLPLSDSNVRPSEDVLRFISRNPHTKEILKMLFSPEEVTIPYIHPQLNISHLVEERETNVSYLLSFLFYMGALTIGNKTSTTNNETLCIPNNQCRREYLGELRHVFELAINDKDLLDTAVNQMSAGDLQPLCNFIIAHLFNLEKKNDVIHSQESSLKVCFIFAVSLSRGPDYAHSEYDEVPNTCLDAFFDPCTNAGQGVHIEFKNTTVGQIDSQYNPNDWDKMNDYSNSLVKLSMEELLSINLKIFPGMFCPYLKKNMSTIGDKWESVMAQAKVNRQKLQTYRSSIGNESKFITYAVYRIGLKVLLWDRIN